MRLPTGTIADLHWALFNEERRRKTFPMRTDDVLARAVTVEVDGSPVRTLSDEDTLVHLALHACQSGGTRLLWCKDLEQAVTGRPVDWDAVVRRVPPNGTRVRRPHRRREAHRDRSASHSPTASLQRLSPQPLWRWLMRVDDQLVTRQQWSGGRSMRRDPASRRGATTGEHRSRCCAAWQPDQEARSRGAPRNRPRPVASAVAPSPERRPARSRGLLRGPRGRKGTRRARS